MRSTRFLLSASAEPPWNPSEIAAFTFHVSRAPRLSSAACPVEPFERYPISLSVDLSVRYQGSTTSLSVSLPGPFHSNPFHLRGASLSLLDLQPGGSTQMHPSREADEERDSQSDPSRHGDSDSTDDHEEEQRPLREKGGRRRKKKKVGAERFSDIALYKLRNDSLSYSQR